MKEFEKRQLLKKEILQRVIADLKNKKATKKNFPHGLFAGLSDAKSLLFNSRTSVLLTIDRIFLNLDENDSVSFIIEALQEIEKKPISKIVEYKFFIFTIEQNIKCIKEIAIFTDLRDQLLTLLNECRELYIQAVKNGVFDDSKLSKARLDLFSFKKKWVTDWKKIEDDINNYANKEIVKELRVINRASDSAQNSLDRRFPSDLDTSVINNVTAVELMSGNKADIYKIYSRELLQLIKKDAGGDL